MRAKIAKELWGIYSEDEPEIGEDFYEQADSILEIICSEIEKVENPYPNDKLGELNNGFEYCRAKILTLLRK